MKIICVARNYTAHAEEMGDKAPDEPVFFMKPATSYLAAGGSFPYPSFSQHVDYECEIVLKLGSGGKNLDENVSINCISHITLGIDFTARDIQKYLKQNSYPWETAKAFDNSAAVGNFLNWSDYSNHSSLKFILKQNGDVVQRGDSTMMIHSLSGLISKASRYFTLEAGDLIFTGTPEGVGPVRRGDQLTGILEGNQILDLDIR